MLSTFLVSQTETSKPYQRSKAPKDENDKHVLEKLKNQNEISVSQQLSTPRIFELNDASEISGATDYQESFVKYFAEY